MTLDEFRATAAPCHDALWAVILDNVENPAPRDKFTVYDGEYVLHEADEKFWPHAWWYSPVPYATKAEAEAVLHEWRKEWI